MSQSHYPSIRYIAVDGVVLFTVTICTFSSILCEFSNINTLGQFDKLTHKNQLHFSLGKGHEHLRYFFELTLWNLWLAVVVYMILWDMLFRKLLCRHKKITPSQRIINRIFTTFSLSIGFLFWSLLGIPKALKHQVCLFKMVNTLGLHFLIPAAVLVYYFARNKADLVDKKITYIHQKKIQTHHRIIKPFETHWQSYLLFFYLFSIIFAILSYVLQFYITTNCTPVYDGIVDWRHPLIASSICLITPLIFTSIFYIMHVKNKYTEFLRGVVLTFIVSCMSFTLSYSLLDGCLHYNPTISWSISCNITILLSLTIFAIYYFYRDKHVEIVFPPLEAPSNTRLAQLDSIEKSAN